MAHDHHHHSHASDISATERERITSFCAAEAARGDEWVKRAEQVLGELAFYSMQRQSKTGLWSMGEIERFVVDYMPSHTGDAAAAAAAPEIVTTFARWLVSSGQVPTCDVGAIEKRLRKIGAR